MGEKREMIRGGKEGKREKKSENISKKSEIGWKKRDKRCKKAQHYWAPSVFL